MDSIAPQFRESGFVTAHDVADRDDMADGGMTVGVFAGELHEIEGG